MNHEPQNTIDANDKLIDTLRSSFSELIKKQDEHTERLERAVEALRPQTAPTDAKSTFWTMYMKLADEHDKEFQQKYSTDLDTALIFAGLFSAVSSAFIIQIEPKLESDPLSIIVAVQSLLYISLFTTLLAALLAVLGKQWVMHYQAAGSRGTMEERGLERQRKLDGLRRWKFDAILQMFPLLLQLALLLFSSALSLYLWTVHRSIAAIVLALTIFGVSAYICFLASAILSSDSPFQTPLAPIAAHIGSQILRTIDPVLDRIRRTVNPIPRKINSYLQAPLTRFTTSTTFTLPSFLIRSVTPDRKPLWQIHPETFFTKRSPEVPAIAWILETTTDPRVIDAAAEIAVALQWPLNMNLAPSLARLMEALKSCFYTQFNGRLPVHKLRKGMASRAIMCGRAYCSLRHISRAAGVPQHKEPHWHCDWTVPNEDEQNNSARLRQLWNVIRVYNEWPDSPNALETTSVGRWALRVIPLINQFRSFGDSDSIYSFSDQFHVDESTSIDQAVFTDYLCCISSLIRRLDGRILARRDKSRWKFVLITELFKNLGASFLKAPTITRVIETTAELAHYTLHEDGFVGSIFDMLSEISTFCCLLYMRKESPHVFVTAATLGRVEDLQELEAILQVLPSGVEWVFTALEHLQQSLSDQRQESSEDSGRWDNSTTLAVRSLLQFLILGETGNFPNQPSEDVMNMIVSALLIPPPADISFAAFLVLCKTRTWSLSSITQQNLLYGSTLVALHWHTQEVHHATLLWERTWRTLPSGNHSYSQICVPGLISSPLSMPPTGNGARIRR